MNIKNTLTITFLTVLALCGWYVFSSKQQQPKALYTTATPVNQDIKQFVNATGTLEARDQITIGSLEAGRVISIRADDNDKVKKGQILAVLDNGIGDSAVKKMRSTLHEQQARLEYQELFFKRQQNLYEAKQISQDTYEKEVRDLHVARSRVHQTKAELELQEKSYNNLFITSPDDGIVIARQVDIGQMVTSRLQATVLYVIAKDLHEMEARIDVDEADIGLIRMGQEVEFSVDAFPKKTFHATVKQIQYLAKTKDNVVTYSVLLDAANPNLSLRPGMTVMVDIKVADEKNALCVPNKVFRINNLVLADIAKTLNMNIKELPEFKKNNDIDHVWVLQDNTFVQIAVEVGASNRRFTQIKQGLTAQSMIISSIQEPQPENPLLKGVFGRSMIGKK